MEAQLGRVATPAIVVGGRVFWGFEYNKTEIAEAVGVSPEADESVQDEPGREAGS